MPIMKNRIRQWIQKEFHQVINWSRGRATEWYVFRWNFYQTICYTFRLNKTNPCLGTDFFFFFPGFEYHSQKAHDVGSRGIHLLSWGTRLQYGSSYRLSNIEVLITTAKIHFFLIRTAEIDRCDILRYHCRTIVTQSNVPIIPCNSWNKF